VNIYNSVLTDLFVQCLKSTAVSAVYICH